MDSLGARLRAVRQRLKLTQKAFGEAVGVTEQSVSMWERGERGPSRESLDAMRRVHGIPIDFLLYGGDLPEHIENGIVDLSLRGRNVPMVEIASAARRSHVKSQPNTVFTHFTCDANSYALSMPDDSNEPKLEKGETLILSPDKMPHPGDLVLGSYGPESRPIIGELRYETTAKGHVTIVAPLNPRWSAARSDVSPLEIIAAVVGSIRQFT